MTLSGSVPIYLLHKDADTKSGPAGGDKRRYERHWTPIHPDFTVKEISAATTRARAVGAVQEGGTCEAPYGKLAMFADPFGHGFCLIEFSAAGYDTLLQAPRI